MPEGDRQLNIWIFLQTANYRQFIPYQFKILGQNTALSAPKILQKNGNIERVKPFLF